jgi:hypothetical protein
VPALSREATAVKIVDLSVPIMNYSMDTHERSPVA